jgi:hypothetical protein
MLIYSKQPIGPSADLKERMLDTATGLVYEKYGSGNVFVHRIGGNSSGATYVDDAAIALWALSFQNGRNTVRITAVDQAGNQSTETFEIDVQRMY